MNRYSKYSNPRWRLVYCFTKCMFNKGYRGCRGDGGTMWIIDIELG